MHPNCLNLNDESIRKNMKLSQLGWKIKTETLKLSITHMTCYLENNKHQIAIMVLDLTAALATSF